MPTPTLPFDALRPFKNRPEQFTPRDTLPWLERAEQFLRYRTRGGTLGLRPVAQIEADVAWLAANLDLPPGAAILDVGCGPGLYSNPLAACGYRVTGIDIAQPFLDYAHTEAEARSLATRCTYRRLSLFNLAYQAEFEAVLLINSVAKCLTPADLEPGLARIRAALTPGGQFICELAVQPAGFTSTEPALTETLSFLAHSPWCDQFHAWLLRELTFPDSRERVTHHLILGPDGHPAEYWSRFYLYPTSQVADLLNGCGFRLKAAFGPSLGHPLRATDDLCFIWAERADLR